MPCVPSFADNNAHMFYLVFENVEKRSLAISKLKENNVLSVFHYLSLHESPFYKDKHDGRALPLSNHYSNSLLRLPMYYELSDNEINKIIELLNQVNY